tara:strand:- start:821 stop:1252 length:432 start_codon:yes stop_codon:yes gene_type:complete
MANLTADHPYQVSVGINHVGAYQVSGRPYASASIDAKHGLRPGGYEIEFPYVTKWFQIINGDTTNACKVAFSLSGMTGSNNYFTIDAAPTGDHKYSEIYDTKVSSIWISGSTDVQIVAGLTSILPNRTTTISGSNFSGSVGVG